VAGPKGHPDAVKKGRKGRCRRLKGARGRGTLDHLGMLQRGGEVVVRRLENVRQPTIQPRILSTVPPGTTIYTDEYDCYARLPDGGYAHKTVPQPGRVCPR
jgi:transposase